jgi:hypothetical protein
MWYLETGNINSGCGSADFIKAYNLAKSIKTKGNELVYVKFYASMVPKYSYYRIGIISDVEIREAIRRCRVGNKKYHLLLLDIISPLSYESKGHPEFYELSRDYLGNARDKFLGFILNDPERTQVIYNTYIENSKDLLKSCF